MASPIELAVVELQILMREFNRRIGGIERRLGIESEPFVPRAERVGGQAIHVPLSPRMKVERVAAETTQEYEVASPAKAVVPPPVEPPPQPAVPVPVEADEAPPSPEAIVEELRVMEEKLAERMDAVAKMVSAAPAGEPPPASPVATPQAGGVEIPLTPPPLPGPPPSAKKVMEFLQQHPLPYPEPRGNAVRLEMTLGTWVTSWLAAFSIMGAVLFFLKLAMDNGVLFMSPQWRVGLAVFAGLGMITYGYWAHARRYKALADGLAGAGIVTLLVAIFAAHITFVPEMISWAGAFLAIPLVCALGIILSYLQRAPVLAYLSFAGLYASPLILQGKADHTLVVLAYVTLVTAAALVLGGRFRMWEPLRLGGFVVGWAWMAYWITTDAAVAHGLLGFAFICMLYVLFLAEMCLHLWRAMHADPASPRAVALVLFHDSIAAVFSAINAAVGVLLCYFLFQRGHLPNDWVFAIALAGLMALLSRVIRSEGFKASAVFQTFVLLGVSACMAFYGTHMTAAFAILAILFATYAVMKNSTVARTWMFAFLLLTAFRVIAFDSTDELLQDPLFTVGTCTFTTWMLLAWWTALTAMVFAWLSRPSKRPLADGTTQWIGAAWTAIGCIVVSTVLVFVVNSKSLAPGGPFTLASVLWIFALIALMRLRTLAEIGTALEAVASVLLMLLSLKWLAFDGVAREGIPAPVAMWPFLNVFAGNAILLAVAVLFLLLPAREHAQVGRRFMGWWLFGIGFALVNLETLRGIETFMPSAVVGIGSPGLVQNVALTGLWSVVALGMIVVGFAVKSRMIRSVALVLIAFTVAKMVLVDMANVETILRVFSLMLLGIVLFVMSYLYHRSPQNGIAKPQGTS